MYASITRNASTMLWSLSQLLQEHGKIAPSRNGPVRVADGPVLVRVERPQERVIFWPARDANPFFHLVEAIWMLGGARDVATMERFNRRMASYSDDGDNLHGAYGYRWRQHFGRDQIMDTIDLLRAEPETRRAVIAMWDPRVDGTAREGKDFPCNTHLYLRIQTSRPEDPFTDPVFPSRLEMTVCSRSSDLFWGLAGANIVHFSMLLEFMASLLQLEVGPLTFCVNNLHAYERHWPLLERAEEPWLDHRYDSLEAAPFPGVEPAWQAIAAAFDVLNDSPRLARHLWVDTVFAPMVEAHNAWRAGFMRAAYEAARRCEAQDWRVAALEWLDRHAKEEQHEREGFGTGGGPRLEG